jgi:hypothetical protein
MTETKEYILTLQIVTLETKLNAIVDFLSNMEHFNQDEIGTLKSYIKSKLDQEKDNIAEKVIAIVGQK